jgi:hypothetical protein
VFVKWTSVPGSPLTDKLIDMSASICRSEMGVFISILVNQAQKGVLAKTITQNRMFPHVLSLWLISVRRNATASKSNDTHSKPIEIRAIA